MSKHCFRGIVIAAIIMGYLNLTAPEALAQSGTGLYQEMPGLKRFFDEAGVAGTIIVQDMRKGTVIVYNSARANTGYLPSSTFKIPNSLIALEFGIVKEIDGDIFKWSGSSFTLDGNEVLIEGKPLLPEACKADITLRIALSNSCIPVYQEIARLIGVERYKSILTRIAYGNADIGSAPVDRFWLEGDFKISAVQQIDFLKKFYREELPFSKRTFKQVKDIMVVEKTPQYTIRAKTGYAFTTNPGIGWWVGWVEDGDDVFFFAMNIDLPQPKMELLRARFLITKAVLKDLGIL